MSRFGRTLNVSDYEITREGNVINKISRVIVKGQPNNKGYLRVVIGGNAVFIHRLVAEKYVPNPYNKPQVNHIDGNKKNNQAENLEWVTNQENREHAVANGLHSHGEKCSWSKLNWNDVKNIRSMYPNIKIIDIAKRYNVSRGTIADIVYGRTWKPVEKIC